MKSFYLLAYKSTSFAMQPCHHPGICWMRCNWRAIRWKKPFRLADRFVQRHLGTDGRSSLRWRFLILEIKMVANLPSLDWQYHSNDIIQTHTHMYICIHSLRGYTMLPSMSCKFWVMEVRHGSIESYSRFRMLFNTALILLKVHGWAECLWKSNAFNSLKPRWWFEISFIFTPIWDIWGRFPIWLQWYFSDGLKLPTRNLLTLPLLVYWYPQFRPCRHFPTPLSCNKARKVSAKHPAPVELEFEKVGRKTRTETRKNRKGWETIWDV